jgi:hypothetical protein
LDKRLNIIVFVVFYIIIAILHRPSGHLLDVYVISSLFFSVVMFNFFMLKIEKRNIRTPEKWVILVNHLDRDISKVLILGGMIYICYIIGLYFHAGTFAWSSLDKAFRTLLGISYMGFAHIYVGITRLNGLFLTWSMNFNWISPVLWILVVIEFIAPGGVVKVIDDFITLLLRQMREKDISFHWRFNWSEMILLIVLAGIGVFTWKHILAEGYYIGIKEILGLIYLFLCFIILPVALLTFLIRNKKIQSFLARFTFQGE